jgi:hypothetical protein
MRLHGVMLNLLGTERGLIFNLLDTIWIEMLKASLQKS